MTTDRIPTSEPAAKFATQIPNPSSMIRMVGVTREFLMGEVRVPVLRGVDFDLHAREVVAVVGPSGSGKTTILNLMGGLDQPSSGEVWYQNLNLATLSAAELTLYRRNHVGFIFQLYNLVPTLTALENIAVATEISSQAMEPCEALKRVGLENRQHHFPSQLSGGEQQRVAIARAIAKRPDLLLCDEPTGALDFKTGRKVIEILVDLNRSLGTTVVIITHNRALARIANRTIYLQSGRVTRIEMSSQPASAGELQW
jgi:putative ABC transport system ATP-binding protein